MTTTTKLSSVTRRSIVRSADVSQSNIKIEVIPGIALAPRLAGETAHYETRIGQRIYHPTSYARKGWSSMCYVASSRRVLVGEQWIAHLA